MDVNDLRIGVTLLSLAAFIGIAAWAWSRRQATRFGEAAQLPFVGEAAAEGAPSGSGAPPGRPLP